jgi:hypothetical protein
MGQTKVESKRYLTCKYVLILSIYGFQRSTALQLHAQSLPALASSYA